MTYNEAWKLVENLASNLCALGVRKGDRVAICARNSLKNLVVMFGAMKSGAIASYIDPLNAGELEHYLKIIEPKVLIFSGDLAEHIRRSRSRMRVEFYISLDEYFDYAMSWEEAVSKGGAPPCPEPLDEDPCHLAFTSGTTYTPKPAVLAHEPTCKATQIIAEHLGLGEEDTTLGITTLASSHILVYGILPQLHVGAPIGIMERWDPEEAWRIVMEKKVRVLSGTSILFQEMIDEAERMGIKDTPLKFILTGGSPAYRALRNRWEKLGIRVIETYGMSELGGAAALGYPKEMKQRPVKPFEHIPPIGPPPRDKVVKILDENGRELPPGKPGRIVIGGGHMWGYWRMPEETARVIRNGWLYTDDIGFLDEHGNLYFLARQTEVIRSRDKTIYPRVVEEILYLHPRVLKAAVIGKPDPEKGEIPKLYIQPKPGAQILPEEIMKYCKENLDSSHMPDEIEVLDELPMTSTGKIDKNKLKRSAA